MGNTVASGSGYSLEVGKNCEKLTQFTSNVVLTFKDFKIYKIQYNNSKYGKACLAGTQDNSDVILAQNQFYNFQWQVIQNQDTGENSIIGNHTRKGDKNSLAIFEIMQIQPMVLQADKEKINAVAYKFKNDSELAVQITKLKN
jgi:hypothetical protein